jgi:hypothetical protein
MAKILDDRLVYEVAIESVTYKPNVLRTTVSGVVVIDNYVTLTRIVYNLLNNNGGVLSRTVVSHDLMPIDTPDTCLECIDCWTTLSPLIQAAVIADRDEFIVSE